MNIRPRSIWLAAVAAALVGLSAAPAEATTIDRFSFEESGGEPAFIACDGFAIDLSSVSRVAGTVHFDTHGDWAKTIVHTTAVDTLTNNVTGKTVINRGVFQQTFTRIGDTDQFTHTLVGYRYLATDPHEGVVLQDVGRIEYSMDESELYFVSGQHDLLRDDENNSKQILLSRLLTLPSRSTWTDHETPCLPLVAVALMLAGAPSRPRPARRTGSEQGSSSRRLLRAEQRPGGLGGSAGAPAPHTDRGQTRAKTQSSWNHRLDNSAPMDRRGRRHGRRELRPADGPQTLLSEDSRPRDPPEDGSGSETPDG